MRLSRYLLPRQVGREVVRAQEGADDVHRLNLTQPAVDPSMRELAGGRQRRSRSCSRPWSCRGGTCAPAARPRSRPARRGSRAASSRPSPGCRSGCPAPAPLRRERVMRAAYSSTRLPPKTRCVWRSTKPGATILPVTSMTRARGRVDLAGDLLGRADRQDAFTGDRELAPARRPMGSAPVATHVSTSAAPRRIRSAWGRVGMDRVHAVMSLFRAEVAHAAREH